MGMFDYVEYEANCQSCGEKLVGFQSKDGGCNLQLLQPKDVGFFYTSCDACDRWHEYTVNRVCTVQDIEAYMTPLNNTEEDEW